MNGWHQWRVVAAVLLLATPTLATAADDFPSRTVKIIVPAPPGTVLDTLPRILADELATKWKQPVVVENRPGFAQNIGAEAVAKSEPDGYTLLATPPGPLVVSQYLYPNLAFDPRAFVPITVLVTLPGVLVANPKLPATSLQSLFAYAKANPAKITYASPGHGSTPQLAMEELARQAGIRLVHVPYQGMAPAQRDVVAGHVDLMINDVGNVLPLIQDGQLKAIAATGERRVMELPQLPTVSETLPQFVHSEWFALVAPPKTPDAVVEALSRAVGEALRSEQVVQRYRPFAVAIVASSPAETASFLHGERERWRKIISATGTNLH